MSNLVHQGSALPSIERARALLASCRTDREVKKIRSIAQAVKTLERGKEIACDAAEIIVDADRRLAELDAEEKREAHRPKKSDMRVGVSEAVQKSRERRAPLLAVDPKIDRGVREAFRKNLVPVTTGAIVAVAKLAEKDPEAAKRAIAKLEEKPEIKAALGAVKLEAKRALAEEIRANPVITPDGRYQVIAIDPPWKYDSRADDTTHRGKNLYPDMSVDEIIAKTPVAAKAQDDCVLWLWTTNAFMRDAYRCLDAWGFREKTILTWDKELIGLGDWLRNVTEHCILAVRGRPVVSLTNQTTIIREKRREHSRKPEAFYKLVEQLCPGSKLEFFARAPRDGWTAWGAETEKFDAP